ncbi:MAG: DNA mismatch repair endonuclease MutL [Parachlamydiaceae bacterium]|nr:DNA mismatch repair endonuclease MutL [Parachlamydiaceae bacterium]
MPSKIRVLTEHTINKIAAGEVIENPSSVVKELVENSIDANASEICIEIKGGGRQLIRITDDGCGMNNDDALLCLERHATSKIREVEDIHDVTTMGFRGEAIPSIASISKFMLLTCPQPENSQAVLTSEPSSFGTMLMVDGGKIINCSTAARSPGTTIEVKNLFFNVPVRKKFLKSPTVDTNEILKMTSIIALGHPTIKFQLISDNKTLLTTQISQDNNDFKNQLNTRVEAILGHDFLENCISLKHAQDGLLLQGVIGLPSYTRHNRTGQYLFINNRGVFSPLVAYAIKEGYGTALPSGRHPVFVLHLSITGNLVDVNVHPQKREVRLRQEHVLKDLIIKGIEQALQSSSFHSQNVHSQVSPVFANTFNTHSGFPLVASDEDWVFRPKSLSSWNKSEELRPSEPTPHFEIGEISEDEPIYAPLSSIAQRSIFQEFQLQEPQKPQEPLNFLNLPRQARPPRVIATIPRFIILDGTGDSEFILAGRAKGHSTFGGLFLIDQKAAHSRVIFEKLQENEEGQITALQSLLIPYSIEVSAFEAAILRASVTNLCGMGIHIREFGTNTFLIDAIPQIFGDSNLQVLITDILQALREMQSDQLLQDEKNKRIALAASRTSVSYDRRLSLEEAQALMNQLSICRHPYQCPQGKSTLLQLSPEELVRQFHKQ